MEAAAPRPKQRSRLQRHAPSTIKVDAPTADASEWRVVIPLLSPLAAPAAQRIPDETTGAAEADVLKAKKKQKQKAGEDLRWPGWQHPAAPFFYEPPPGNVPVFLLPNQCS